MVRFKNRYFLCEYYQEDQKIEIASNQLIREIKESIHLNFGDFGLGKISFSLNMKYLNSVSRIFILRAARDQKDIVWNSLIFMKNLDGQPFHIRILGCSGTIKKCEIKARRLLTRWIHKVLKNELPEQMKEALLKDYRQTQQILQDLN